MLTMGGPIPLKSARDVGTLGGMFGERIRGNYEQMQGRINPVEILHFLSAPPELYVAATDMTTLVNQQNGTEIKNLELSLVNNVLNRILVSDHMEFTYQDRVFVENILKKIGVTDVREFIRQVQRIKEETGTVRELLTLYESGRDTLKAIQEYRVKHTQMQRIQEKKEEKGEGELEAADRMAAVVLKRLRTNDIYREVGRYAAFRFGSRTMLDRFELSFGEQSIAASYLTLNDYRSRVFEQGPNTVYNLPERYEAWHLNLTDENHGQFINNFLRTALLHAVGQIFHLRYTEFKKNTGLWHEFTDALHVSVRNTFQRFENLSAMSSFTIQDREAYHRTVQHFERQEISALKHLFAISGQRTADATHDAQTVQVLSQDRTTVIGMQRQDKNVGAMRQEDMPPPDHPPREVTKLRIEREEEIRRQLERINRQNIERVERLSKYTDRMKESERLRIDRETTKAAPLKISAGQEQVTSAYRDRETPHAAQAARETEKLREILGDETVRVFETICGFQENPEQYPNVTAAEEKTMNLFLRDIAAAGEPQTVVTAKEQGVVVYEETEHGAKNETGRAFGKLGRGVQPDTRRHGRTLGQTENTVELFHRQNSQTVDEESVQEWIRTWNKDKRVQNTDIRKTFQEDVQVAQLVQSKVNEMKVKQDEEIARMISQNVKRQLDTLSEKVYGKLEKRMDAERRRRGL